LQLEACSLKLSMVSFPTCKINLGLNIINKRPDGYHNIETCFYPVPWTDILEIIPSNEMSFTSSGNIIPGDPNDNLCVKAYQILKEEYSIPSVRIHLHKIIPSGAGLGGGSSDAAFVLRMLNDIFEMGLSPEKLSEHASRLGSDCAFFVQDEPKIGSGRGEQLHNLNLDLKGKFLVIVKPEINIPTAAAYAGVAPAKPVIAIQNILENYSISEWRNLLQNDFEKTVFDKHPTIKKIKEKLYEKGALYASMSGSGSAVFGIFNEEVKLTTEFAGVTFWSGLLK
jgi:4-diphosphocytidyl-2-C-methyl-D-erythritol kinase